MSFSHAVTGGIGAAGPGRGPERGAPRLLSWGRARRFGVASAATAAVVAITLTGCSDSSGDSEEQPSGKAQAVASVAAPSTSAAPSPASSASSASATPEPTAEPTASAAEPTQPVGLSAAQQALVDKLLPDVVSDCAGYPGGEGGDVTAAVVCSAGDDRSVQAFAYPDQAAMSRAAQARGAGLSHNGECSKGDDVATTWQVDYVTQGDLVCVREQDRYVIYWTHYSDLVGFRIDGDAADGPGLYTYWVGFDPI